MSRLGVGFTIAPPSGSATVLYPAKIGSEELPVENVFASSLTVAAAGSFLVESGPFAISGVDVFDQLIADHGLVQTGAEKQTEIEQETKTTQNTLSGLVVKTEEAQSLQTDISAGALVSKQDEELIAENIVTINDFAWPPHQFALTASITLTGAASTPSALRFLCRGDIVWLILPGNVFSTTTEPIRATGLPAQAKMPAGSLFDLSTGPGSRGVIIGNGSSFDIYGSRTSNATLPSLPSVHSTVLMYKRDTS